MNRDIYYSYIDEKLHILAHRITTNGKLNMLRLHLHSENFYLYFFNLLYGYKLKNLNDVSQNVEAIDLIDHQKRIMIQVSSTSTKQKIESALDKLKEYVGYEFKFISIAKDATDLRDKTYKNPNSITFDPLKDIYDIRSFLNTVSSLDIEKLKKVYDFIHQELGDGSENRFTPNILKEKYLNDDDFSTIKLLINSRPKPIEHMFINLAIIKDKEEKQKDRKIPEKQIYDSNWEAIHKPKEPIEIKDLIQKSSKSLIYGKAGIGKTTLCKYITYMWAKGKLYEEFEYVIYLPLRKWSSTRLKEEIRKYYTSQYPEDIILDVESNDKILFLFDGYDELKSDKKQEFQKAIKDSQLTHYVITSRPYGYQKNDFSVDEHFETIGFTDKNVEKYIEIFFKENSEKSKRLKDFLQNNISIKHIGYIPLMLEMICSLWEEKEFNNSLTMTELYTYVIENMLTKHSANRDDTQVYKRKNRKQIKEQLGKISFKGLIKQTIIFNGDFIEDSIDDIDFFEENVIRSGFLKSDTKEKDLLDNYLEFPHLTFQEYFAALYVSTLSKEEQSKIIRDWKFYPYMQMFFAFLGGLIEDKEFLLSEIENSKPIDILGFYESNLTLICAKEIQDVNEIRRKKILEKYSKGLSRECMNSSRKILLEMASHSIFKDFFDNTFKDFFFEKEYCQLEILRRLRLMKSSNIKNITNILIEILRDNRSNEITLKKDIALTLLILIEDNIEIENFCMKVLYDIENEEKLILKIEDMLLLLIIRADNSEIAVPFIKHSYSPFCFIFESQIFIDIFITILKDFNIENSIKKNIAIFLFSNMITITDETIETFLKIIKDQSLPSEIKDYIIMFLLFLGEYEKSIFITLLEYIQNEKIKKNIFEKSIKNMDINIFEKLIKNMDIKNFIDSKISQDKKKITSLNKTKKKIIKQKIQKNYSTSSKYDMKSLFFFNEKEYQNTLIDMIDDKTVNILYRQGILNSLESFLLNNNNLIEIFIKNERNYERNYGRIIIETLIEMSNNFNSKISDLIYALLSPEKEKTFNILIELTTINEKFEKYFKKNIKFLFLLQAYGSEKIDVENEIINYIIQNKKCVYMKNNKLCTIENGQEICTKKDIDAIILNEKIKNFINKRFKY